MASSTFPDNLRSNDITCHSVCRFFRRDIQVTFCAEVPWYYKSESLRIGPESTDYLSGHRGKTYKISWPNRITITRILLIGPFVVALLHLQNPVWSEHARWAAMAVFAVMAISDGLDGYLARRLHEESVVGRILDPLADKLLILCSVVLLAHEGTHVTGMRLPSTIAVIAIWKDLVVVVGFCIVYFITSRVYINPQRWGKWCTMVQLVMVIVILLSPNLPRFLSRLPAVLWWMASMLAMVAVVHYYRLGMHFISQYETQAPGQS